MGEIDASCATMATEIRSPDGIFSVAFVALPPAWSSSMKNRWQFTIKTLDEHNLPSCWRDAVLRHLSERGSRERAR